jgi:hypothetical protein
MPLKCETNMLQDPREFALFLKLVKQDNVASYLEIGCKHGGTLWRIANLLPKGAKIVAVDLPQADGSFKNSKPNLEACCEELRSRGYDVTLFLGDSTDRKIVDAVAKLAPFDLCFIDGDHTFPYCKADWENYGAMAKMVAFHDIGWKEKYWRTKGWKNKGSPHDAPIAAPLVWNEVKIGRRHTEIILSEYCNGIGVLWQDW